MADGTGGAAHQAAAAAFHALQTPPHVAPGAAPSVAASGDSARGPYRGKCLYKTGKCPNERALKTSGAAHNLCDEHRRRQNEHQRKLDSKNRFSRKDKRACARTHHADGADAAAAEGLASSGSEATKRYERANVKHAATDPAAGADAIAAAAAAAKGVASDTLAQLAPAMMQAAAVSGSLHALAAPPPSAGSGAAVPQTQQTPVSDATGKLYGPAGAQPPPPHMAYPYVMQDFDGIMVPLPSCFEGHERVEVRTRVHQKVLDYISEECIRRFSGKAIDEAGFSSGAAHPQQLMPPQQPQLRGHISGASSDATATTGGYFAPQLLQQQQQQQQQHVMYQNEGARNSEREKRAVQSADASSFSDNDDDSGAADRELEHRGAKKSRVASRSLRDRPAKHARADI